MFKRRGFRAIHARKLTWKPKKGPMKTTVLLNGDYMGFHVSLGECRALGLGVLKLAWALRFPAWLVFSRSCVVYPKPY